MSASSDERAMWLDAISDEMASLDSKGTWIPVVTTARKPLPTHVVLKAHLAWHTKLVRDLSGLGFHELPSAPCVFMQKEDSALKPNQESFILVYVDDLLILSPTADAQASTLKSLHALYDICEMGRIDIFLGVHMQWDHNGRWVHMSQPDVIVAVSILAKFNQSPTAYYNRGAKRVLRYLCGSRDVGVLMRAGELKVSGYVDSDYAGNTLDCKSISGVFVKIDEAPYIWGSKKQVAVALPLAKRSIMQ
eukprot:IDg9109t1